MCSPNSYGVENVWGMHVLGNIFRWIDRLRDVITLNIFERHKYAIVFMHNIIVATYLLLTKKRSCMILKSFKLYDSST